MPVRLDMGGVNHEPLEVRLVYHDFEQPLPDAFVSPPAKSTLGVIPTAKLGWQVAPRSTGTQNPDNGIDESAIILGDTTPISPFPRKMWGDNLPSAIGDVVTVHGIIHNLLRCQPIPEKIRIPSSKINARVDRP